MDLTNLSGSSAFDFLEKNPRLGRQIDLLGFDRVLRRGTGKVLEETGSMLFLYDTVSKAHFLACDDIDTGLAVLDRYDARRISLLMVADIGLGRAAFRRYGFSDRLECRQAAWYGEAPEPDPEISVKTAGMDDLPLLTGTYDLISPEEMEQVVERGSILLGYHRDHLIGFIGEHLEGSMGLLYVFPEFRRQGFGAALEKICISETLKKSFIPFGQVEKDNQASLALQKSIGMTVSDRLLCWMWR